MDSANEKPLYPRRVYEPGKAPFLNHSINHNCSFTNLGMVKEYLGDIVWESMEQSAVGVFLKLATKGFTFSSVTVHHFLTNQLQTTKPHEFWSLIGDEPIRFSLHEFAAISGLNCSPFDKEDKLDVCHKDFWTEMGIDTTVGPCWNELQNVLPLCGTWTIEKKKMVGLLCVLCIGIFGISKSSRIPLHAAKRVLDFEAFERHPWGRLACESLVNGVKVVSFQNDSYVVNGFLYILQVWAYESVQVLGEKLGVARGGLDEVPLLRWKGSRKRFKYSDILEKEMEEHKKVRVRNMYMQDQAEIYPQWDDDVEDTKVDNLIQDLVHGRYCRSFYKEVDLKKPVKRKAREQKSPSKKIEKGMKEGTSMECEQPEHEKEVEENEKDNCCKEGPAAAEVSMAGISQMLKEFGGTLMASMEVNIGKTVFGLEETLQAKLEANQAVNDARFEQVERMVEEIKKSVQALESKESANVSTAIVTAAKKAESSSNISSWGAYKVQTSEGIPIACAVKKTKTKTAMNKKRKVPTNNEVSSKLRVAPKHKELKSRKQTRREPKPFDDAASMDVKKEKELLDRSEPDEKEKALNTFLDGMLEALKEPDAKVPPADRRRVVRAKSQVHPFVGNSTVKRLIPGAVIDPLSLVKDDRLQKLLDFIKKYEGTPIGRNRGMKYLKLMTPKKDWPKNDLAFGWLHDGHMADIMKMFTLRSMSVLTPYCSDRIAFLDPLIVKKWVDDFKQFEAGPKNFKFPEGYIAAFNGNYDDDAQTNRRWYIEVDHLYITHHIKSEHWAALDINLKEERIDVYDSIPSHTRLNEVIQSCRPFGKMLPYLLNQEVPEYIRKKKVAMFGVNRVKNIPENLDVGDCGVYAVKYIERLALGEDFEGLCDANMAAFRLQLACDTYEEVPPEMCDSFEIPQLIDEDIELLEGDPNETQLD